MKYYKQTTNYTCGPSCVSMVLNHFWPKKFALTQDNEYKLWLQTTNPLIGGCPIFALAKILKELGFITKVIYLRDFSPKNYVKRYVKPRDYKAYYALNLFHKKQALKAGVKMEKRKIKFEEIRKWLNEYNFIILLVEVKTLNKNHKKRALHWILLENYKNSKFLIYDPLQGKSWITEKLLKSAFDNVKYKINSSNCALLIKK